MKTLLIAVAVGCLVWFLVPLWTEAPVGLEAEVSTAEREPAPPVGNATVAVEDLDLDTRYTIYRELLDCKREASVEANRRYHQSCQACDGFITDSEGRRLAYQTTAEAEGRARVREKYGIDESGEDRIVREGAIRYWFYDYVASPYPSCCGTGVEGDSAPEEGR